MYLTLDLTDNKDWKDKELSSQSSAGKYFEQCISDSYTWQELTEQTGQTEQTAPESPTYTLTISNDSGANYFQFYGDTDTVCYYQDGEERWFTATPIEGAQSISALFRGWYDDVEFGAVLDKTTVSGDISNFTQAAEAYGKARANAYLQVAPGSAYEVTFAQLYSAEVYDTIVGDDTQFCFTLTLEVQPVEINSVAWSSGGEMKPVDETNQGGHWLKTILVKMQKSDGQWNCVETGTEGISLSN